MIDRSACSSCWRDSGVGYDLRWSGDHWFCRKLIDPNDMTSFGYISKDDAPPPGCPKIFQHGVLTGMTVNIDKKGGDV